MTILEFILLAIVLFIFGPALVVLLLAALYRLWPVWLLAGAGLAYWVFLGPI